MSSRSQSITKSPNQQLARVSIHRLTKRQEIVKYFSAHFGVRLSSTGLHARFGSSFSNRVSEINHDSDCPITIQNETTFVQELEQSVYWINRECSLASSGRTMSNSTTYFREANPIPGSTERRRAMKSGKRAPRLVRDASAPMAALAEIGNDLREVEPNIELSPSAIL